MAKKIKKGKRKIERQPGHADIAHIASLPSRAPHVKFNKSPPLISAPQGVWGTPTPITTHSSNG